MSTCAIRAGLHELIHFANASSLVFKGHDPNAFVKENCTLRDYAHKNQGTADESNQNLCLTIIIYACLHEIRHNSADSVSTSNLVCIKMASILNSQSRDLKHGSAAVPLATTVRSLFYK